jgi:hypothetical protein
MVRNSEGERKTVKPWDPLKDAPPLCKVGVREFRATIKQICEAGEPVLVTRGRSVCGVFVPVESQYWSGPRDAMRRAKQVRASLVRVANALEDS